MDLYILTNDKEEYTYTNVICLSFDVSTYEYEICWINKEHSEMIDKIDAKHIKYFNLA